MRLGFAILFALLIIITGCEPQPEVFAMKTKNIEGNIKATSYYTNGVLSSESISTRNNGIDDVWNFYLDGKIVRIDEDTNFDGVVDKSRSFDPESGGLVLLKVDTNYDGTFDKIEELNPNKSVAEDKITPVDKNKEVEQEEIAEKTKVKIKENDDFVFSDEKTAIETPEETVLKKKQ